jgi:hypothetical protein
MFKIIDGKWSWRENEREDWKIVEACNLCPLQEKTQLLERLRKAEAAMWHALHSNTRCLCQIKNYFEDHAYRVRQRNEHN